jgi:hypothetical protein
MRLTWIFTAFGYLFALLVLVGYSFPVNAQSCNLYTTLVPVYGGATSLQPSCSAAAAEAIARYNAITAPNLVMSFTSSTTTSWRASVVNSSGTLITNNQGGTCSVTQTSNAQQCLCQSKSGKSAGEFVLPRLTSSTPTRYVCDSNCLVNVDIFLCWGELGSTNSGCQGKGSYSGAACTPNSNGDGSSPTNNTSTTPTSPPGATTTTNQPGTCVGYVNGRPYTYTCSTDSTTSTTSRSDGTGVPSSTTTRSVNCDSQTCTTSETTTTRNTQSTSQWNESGPYGERNPIRIGPNGQPLQCATGCAIPLNPPVNGQSYYSQQVCDACYANPPDPTNFPPSGAGVTTTTGIKTQTRAGL